MIRRGRSIERYSTFNSDYKTISLNRSKCNKIEARVKFDSIDKYFRCNVFLENGVCVCVIRKCENFNVVKYFRSFIRRVKQVQRLIAEPTDTEKRSEIRIAFQIHRKSV